METFIPILIAIVVFAAQAYTNYQKEQAKARKRNPAQPPLPEDNAEHLKDLARHPQPIPAPVPSPMPAPAVKSKFDYYSGVVNPDDATRGPHRRSAIPQQLAVDAAAHPQPAFDAGGFDLRDAVIKSIILDRPYK